MTFLSRGAAVLAVLAAVATASALAQRSGTATSRPSGMLDWTPEQQVTGYRSIPRLFRTEPVRRGRHVRALPPAADTIDPRWAHEGRAQTVDTWMREQRVSGVIVLRDGKVVLERYGLGRGPGDTWTSFSVAKSVTALLAGAAIADGRLSLDDPVTRHVPELRGSAYDGVTVRHLLTMSSGTRWNEAYEDPASDIARLSLVSYASDDDLIATLRRLPRDHPPGSTFHYNTADSHLTGVVVARAVGMTLARYLSERIWKPFGMEADAAWIVDPRGRAAAGCCLSATLRDFARIGQFALEDGVANGRRIVPAGFVRDATTVRIGNGKPAPSGYGYLWWIGPRAYEASGIFGQSILIYPKERIVIAINSAWPRPNGDDLWRAMSMFQGAAHDAAAPASVPTIRR